MKKRIAKKIVRAMRRIGAPYSREQMRIATLRVFRSPLYITTKEPLQFGMQWHNGWAIGISRKCFILEQRKRLWRWWRNYKTGRIELGEVVAHYPDYRTPAP